MAKKILSIAAIAILAAGAAILTSCNKDDESLNNEPAMEMKSGSAIENTEKILIARIELFYQQEWNGQEYCDYGPSKFMLCYMYTPHALSDHEAGIPTRFRIGANGTIKSLSINTIDMPIEDRPAFDEYVSNGTITFTSNGPIENSELKEELANDYIEAGTYPIQKVDGDYIITISE